MIDAKGRYGESAVCWIATNATGSYLAEGGFYGYYLERLFAATDSRVNIISAKTKVGILHYARKFNRCIRRDVRNVRIRNKILVHPKKVRILIEEVMP